MRLRDLLVITAVVSLLFGFPILFFTRQMMALYGVEANAGLIYTGQFYGASLIQFAVLAWLSRDIVSEEMQRIIITAFFAHDVLAFIVALRGQLLGVVNVFGWSIVGIYFFFMLSYGYFLFFSKRTAS